MSRIDEAVRRSAGGTAPADPAAAAQQSFAPAWQVSEGERGTENSPMPLLVEPVEADSADGHSTVSISSSWRDRLAIGPDGDPALVEQIRRLAGTLHHARQSQGLTSVMVTSASPGDGKTLTAINLALVLAESFRYRVLLVDADLRRPSIANVVDVSVGTGLSDALRAPTPQKLALVRLSPRLTLLPAGTPISNSIEALVSPRMKQILEEAERAFDWVILDAPPVGSTADARLLSQMVGGTLFVIRAGVSPHEQVSKAIDSLGRDQILGVVLNGADWRRREEDYYYARGTPRRGQS